MSFLDWPTSRSVRAIDKDILSEAEAAKEKMFKVHSQPVFYSLFIRQGKLVPCTSNILDGVLKGAVPLCYFYQSCTFGSYSGNSLQERIGMQDVGHIFIATTEVQSVIPITSLALKHDPKLMVKIIKPVPGALAKDGQDVGILEQFTLTGCEVVSFSEKQGITVLWLTYLAGSRSSMVTDKNSEPAGRMASEVDYVKHTYS